MSEEDGKPGAHGGSDDGEEIRSAPEDHGEGGEKHEDKDEKPPQAGAEQRFTREKDLWERKKSQYEPKGHAEEKRPLVQKEVILWEKDRGKTAGYLGPHKNFPGDEKQYQGEYGAAKASTGLLWGKAEAKSVAKLDLDKRILDLTPIKAGAEGALAHVDAEGDFDLGKWVKGFFKKNKGSRSSDSPAGGGGGGPFAARVGDPTGHGSPLAPGIGSPNVLIGGMPAWRAGVDMHMCPIVKGVVPDVGGMVAMGAPTVFINKMPACRAGDQVMEIPGGPNPIVMGCSTVMIGAGGGGGGGKKGGKSDGGSEGKGGGGTGLKLHGEGQGDLGYAKAEIEGSIVVNAERAEAVLKAGAMVAAAHGQVQGSLTIPLWGSHSITLGGTAEGSAGSLGLEGKAGAGFSKEEGWHAGAELKGAAGLGGGLGFSIGVR